MDKPVRWLSQCGLNCGLCTMRLGAHCVGCPPTGRTCPIVKCGTSHGVGHCFECPEYPCDRFENIDEYDSFITHLHQRSDLERARSMGLEAYGLEQEEKLGLLRRLLDGFNDGRRKTLFCLAVNLLELPELRRIMTKLEAESGAEPAQRATCAAAALREALAALGIKPTLRRKK